MNQHHAAELDEDASISTSIIDSSSDPFKIRRPAELKRIKPEMVIPRAVTMKADVKFRSLLRVEGRMEGRLFAPSTAGLVLCEGAHFQGDLTGLGVVYLDGTLRGDVCVSRLGLGPHALVEGSVSCRRLEVAAGATIEGQVHVSAQLDIPAHNSSDKESNMGENDEEAALVVVDEPMHET